MYDNLTHTCKRLIKHTYIGNQEFIPTAFGALHGNNQPCHVSENTYIEYYIIYTCKIYIQYTYIYLFTCQINITKILKKRKNHEK